MLDDRLVGYLLKALDADEQRQVEQAIVDPEVRRRLQLLEQALAPLEADREQPEPAPGLRYRVLAQIAEHRCQPRAAMLVAPPLRTRGASRSWWRRADVLVAASLLVIVAPLAVPAVGYMKYRHNISQCQDNLRSFHGALMSYADRHGGRLPRVDDLPPKNLAGVVVPILCSEGLAGALNTSCPSSQESLQPLHTLQELESAYVANGATFACLANQLSGG
jgi:hypothetical protein